MDEHSSCLSWQWLLRLQAHLQLVSHESALVSEFQVIACVKFNTLIAAICVLRQCMVAMCPLQHLCCIISLKLELLQVSTLSR